MPELLASRFLMMGKDYFERKILNSGNRPEMMRKSPQTICGSIMLVFLENSTLFPTGGCLCWPVNTLLLH
jgi:hypothetical protein